MPEGEPTLDEQIEATPRVPDRAPGDTPLRWRRHHPALPIVAPQEERMPGYGEEHRVPPGLPPDIEERLEIETGEAYERGVQAGIKLTEDSMPSKRMVPEQYVAALSDEYARKLAIVTEQRDRAMKALQEIADMEGAEDMTDYKFAERACAIANAILDAEAAAETPPSLPDTP